MRRPAACALCATRQRSETRFRARRQKALPAKKGVARKLPKSPRVVKAAKAVVAKTPPSKFAPNTFTPEKKEEFLRLYAEGGSVRSIAAKVGVTSVTVFLHVRKDEDFAKRYFLAMETNTDILEDHLYQMATEKGVPGHIVALFGTLKARRPERWRDVAKIEHSGKVELTKAEDLEAARQRAKLRGAEATH